MNVFIKYILFFALLSQTHYLYSQNNETEQNNTEFTVRGSVVEVDTYNPIADVSISVNGGEYTRTNSAGDFRILVKVGDELIIRHKDFGTVYHTIKNAERIEVEVHPEVGSRASTKRRLNTKQFNNLIDSAEAYLKTDAEKSIQFITEALSQSYSVKQNSEAYEVLADIYMKWKQYDLAISNYRISLQNNTLNEVELKLANAYFKNKAYDESLKTFNEITYNSLSKYQKIIYHEGIGDVYMKTKTYNSAIQSYKKGLDLAVKHLIKPKVTDLNSKIGQAYNETGKLKEANSYFENSLNLASQENKKRAIEEKVKVADFQNDNQAYGTEIQLRKEALEFIEDYEKDTDSIVENESAITPQKQNYKIGNAYYLQKDYTNAIPYLEKSIEEAENNEDLVVKKDAIRKLSETHRDAGNYDKALETYKSYQETVDALYAKMEQEITQASRFSKSISEKQNRITSLESDRALTQSNYQLTVEQSKRQKLVIYSLFGGLLLLLVTAYLMYKYIKQQKLANNLLALKSLRSQMNPHFIFNALNSVNSFIASHDERTANKYLSDFSQLMRSVLENSEEDFIPLEKEIELLELYTQLEHFRFKDKFEYQITVDDDVKINDFQIPPMLLQPYIENAVWHGLRYKEDKGHLNINIATKSNDEITISIVDDGIGRKKSKALKTENQKKQNSKGMNNIKKRVDILNEMYKDKVDVYIDDYQDEDDTGTKVVVTLKKD
ncbi:histidine kinase [Lacinutrix iliipiscaria]|uniref:Histidine kinase n=1 Tax=Lacinutrix iliipiscaria TaxID=1230532 RepID=A0ABW5WI84_9FLAO